MVAAPLVRVGAADPIPHGSALRLTVARCYPYGAFDPKPYKMGDKEYERDIVERFEHEEFFTVDSIEFVDSLKFITQGAHGHGGGGIMPDIFVRELPEFVTEALRGNTLFMFTIEYADRNRGLCDSIDKLTQLLDGDKDLYEEFIAYARKDGMKISNQDAKRGEELLTARLKAYIGRNTELGDNGFYAFIHHYDDTIKRAIEEL